MSGLLRRLRPDNLAGQIAMLVLAAIVLFHLVATTITHFGLLEGRPAPVLPGEVVASSLIALDVAAPSDRAAALAALGKTAPWVRFSVQDARPAAKEEASEPATIRPPLWDDAEIIALARSDERPLGGVAVALHKGGWAVVAPIEKGAALDHPTLWRRLLERSVLFFFLCAALFTAWASRAVVAPLARLAREAERFPDDQGEPHLVEQGPREVRELTRALNRMQDRIHMMMAARSQALAAISHDLRTIITRIRLRTEFIGDEALQEKMLHDVELMDSMLYKNLQHLKGAAEAPEKSFIDLDSVLQTVSDQFADLGHDVTYRGGGRRVILGSLTGMQRVFNNLVENAVTYGKTVAITLHEPNARLVCVEIADDGPGIAPQDRARMLEPFERGDAARNMDGHGGFGLGLSIVRSLVEELGGGLQLLDREPHGLIARVTLPLAFAKE
ncbi:MAG TPA: ATP-binding protein [Methylocystis sp.]|nr:ATP-binding protein [Methylocystis sp.]